MINKWDLFESESERINRILGQYLQDISSKDNLSPKDYGETLRAYNFLAKKINEISSEKRLVEFDVIIENIEERLQIRDKNDLNEIISVRKYLEDYDSLKNEIKNKFKDPRARYERLTMILSSIKTTYERDRNMTNQGVIRNKGLIYDLENELITSKDLSNENEFDQIIDSISKIFPMNFYSGTGYGTGYGSRQSYNLLNQYNLSYSMLNTSVVRIEYAKTLEEFYNIRSHFQAIPFHTNLENQNPDEFPNSTIPWMNSELKNIKSTKNRIEFMQNEVLKQKLHFKEELN